MKNIQYTLRSLNIILFFIVFTFWRNAFFKPGCLTRVSRAFVVKATAKYCIFNFCNFDRILISGFVNYTERYSNSMYNVSQHFKPAPKFEGPLVKVIGDQLNAITPTEDLQKRRIWRDQSLMKLAQLKKYNNYWKVKILNKYKSRFYILVCNVVVKQKFLTLNNIMLTYSMFTLFFKTIITFRIAHLTLIIPCTFFRLRSG